MISTEQLKKMKEVLGHGYAKVLSEKLKEKGVLNSKGSPITSFYISQLFAGKVFNYDVMNAIIDDYEVQKQKISKTMKKLKNL